jgi:curved DNA-binding protein CbpA
MQNYWKKLSVKPNSTSAQIRSAYLAAMQKAHPDKGGSKEQAAIVNKAYEVLGNEESRQQYNEARLAWASEIGASLCITCGEANRIARKPTRHERLVCGHCNTPLEISEHTVSLLQIRTLRIAADTLVQEVGSALLERLRVEVLRRIG